MDASHTGEIGLLAHDLNTTHESIPYRNARLEAASHTLQEVDGFDVACNMEPADGKANLQD